MEKYFERPDVPAYSKLLWFIVLGLVAAILLIGMNWSSISLDLAQTDLRYYARTVNQSKLSLPEKERLLDLIDSLEDDFDQRHAVNYWKWANHNQTIREFLSKGITSDEAQLIARELLRAKRTQRELKD